MRRFLCAALAAALATAAAFASPPAATPATPAPQPAFAASPAVAATLTAMLHEFLAGASANDAAVHDKFWAEDLIYTGSSGRRIGKAEIMQDVRSAPAPKPDDPKSTYTAEDIRIQQYDNAAIVAFRLVATTVQGDSTAVANYFNTGFFVQRDGRWQVSGWQATKIPPPAAK